jgi:thioredoxin 1
MRQAVALAGKPIEIIVLRRPAAVFLLGYELTPPGSAIQLMSGHIDHVSDDTFQSEVLQSDVPVLVDYWAEWCGPCKMIAPILNEVAEEYEGRLKIAKLNIDDNQATPPKYGIRGIPTLMLFKNGNVEAMKVGAVSKSQLTAFIDSNI